MTNHIQSLSFNFILVKKLRSSIIPVIGCFICCNKYFYLCMQMRFVILCFNKRRRMNEWMTILVDQTMWKQAKCTKTITYLPLLCEFRISADTTLQCKPFVDRPRRLTVQPPGTSDDRSCIIIFNSDYCNNNWSPYIHENFRSQRSWLCDPALKIINTVIKS